MTGGWSSKPEWPTDAIVDEVTPVDPKWFKPINTWPVPVPFKEMEQVAIEISKAATDAANFGTGVMQDGKHVPLEKVYNNKMPTHDPYTNPNAQLYYECKCGAILDPGTKSFAALNNAASDQGWKVRWKPNGEGYEPFCVECGKDVE